MCGIAGFIDHRHASSEEMLRLMTDALMHRGPDDAGLKVEVVANVRIGLGHRRLSILDLSAQGHQPFVSECGNYVIVYNGEVYNFEAVRAELIRLGCRFVSNSDTEVLLYAYKMWGMECLEKFIGMFAFCILDKLAEQVILVRDRAGVKPLYYYEKEGFFLFASELKSFHVHPGFEKRLNKAVLPYYFQFGHIPAPHTIFENAYKLEPGHYLVYDLKTRTLESFKYWDVDACYDREKFDKSEQEILEDLETLLTDAVDLRMVADVPVGIFLSGGYDSSLVTALLAKNSDRKLRTFTIGFNEKQYNEAEHAKAVAKHFNTEHTEYYVPHREFLDKVEMLPHYYDEPFGANSAIATMIVSELAKKNVTVALSADGGDEAFCGYSKYFFLNNFLPIFSHRFKREVLKTFLGIVDEKNAERINCFMPQKYRQTNVKEKYGKFKRAIFSKDINEMFMNASSLVAREEVAGFVKIAPKSDLFHAFDFNQKKPFLDEMMRIDYKSFMSDEVLVKVDRATMSTSLEGREPLIDHRIIEFMARVPLEIKYKNNQGKYLARQILYKYIPRSLVDRPKAGFQIPLFEWLRNDLRPLVDKYLDASRLDGDVFELDEVEKIKQELFFGNYANVNKVWFIMTYEMWKEKWFL